MSGNANESAAANFNHTRVDNKICPHTHTHDPDVSLPINNIKSYCVVWRYITLHYAAPVHIKLSYTASHHIGLRLFARSRYSFFEFHLAPWESDGIN